MSMNKINLNPPERIFVLGALEGDFYVLIDFLFTQKFNHKDILILTGNFIDIKQQNSEKMIAFVKESPNIFSIKNTKEKELLTVLEDTTHQYCAFNVSERDKTFLKSLPSLIELNNNLFIISENDGTNWRTLLGMITQSESMLICTTGDKISNKQEENQYNLGSISDQLSCLMLHGQEEPILIII